MPLSAIAASRELMEHWSPGSHGGTYGGGSAIAMQAALATLEVIQTEKLIENTRQQGAHLTDSLIALQKKFPIMADLRGSGLMIACEFVDQGQVATAQVKKIQQACLAAGLMLLTCGTNSNILRWLPPLNVTKQQIDESIKIFAESLESTLL